MFSEIKRSFYHIYAFNYAADRIPFSILWKFWCVWRFKVMCVIKYWLLFNSLEFPYIPCKYFPVNSRCNVWSLVVIVTFRKWTKRHFAHIIGCQIIIHISILSGFKYGVFPTVKKDALVYWPNYQSSDVFTTIRQLTDVRGNVLPIFTLEIIASMRSKFYMNGGDN